MMEVQETEEEELDTKWGLTHTHTHSHTTSTQDMQDFARPTESLNKCEDCGHRMCN